MKVRPYGNTGKSVSEIGFGGWQLGNRKDWAPMEDRDAIALVHEAIERGMQFFDTAPNYGGGRSEELLGEALAGKRAGTVINTKFGHKPDGGTDYDAGAIRRSVEGSLKRLRTDYIDSVLLHNPPFDDLDGKHGHYEELERLKREGKLLAYGASVDSSRELLELMRHSGVGVAEVMFNIFYQEPAEAMRLAAERGIAIVVKIPLDSGWLSGKYNAESTFEGVRSRWSPAIIRKRAELLERIGFVAEDGVPLPAAALRFVLAQPGVATVIPGVRSREQLIANIAAADAAMPEAHVRRLRELWADEIRGANLGW